MNPILDTLVREKKQQMRGGLYHRTQVDMAYNSNHMEGSRLSHEQTRLIYETATIDPEGKVVRVDDVVEAVNHFHCLELVIDHALQPLDEEFIKQLHAVLKTGTSDSRKEWFRVGEYKALPNEVGGQETTAPEQVSTAMSHLIVGYRSLTTVTLHDLLDFHCQFERIHPFQDGNGRVGRLVLFKECLAHNIIPFIIDEDLKFYYYRGLSHWPAIPGYLTDTCLTAQDRYRTILRYFRVPYQEDDETQQ